MGIPDANCNKGTFKMNNIRTIALERSVSKSTGELK